MMQSSPRRLFVIWFAIASGLAIAVAVYFFLQETAPVSLPQHLADAQLMQMIDGERANEILNRMHDKEVTPSTNLIGVYSSGNTVIYLSVYRSRSDARKAYTKMARSIEKGNPLFTDYRVTRLGNLEASFCFGQEQDHYFFVSRNYLYWLAADSPVAEKMASSLVEGL
ncbi:MAG: hypothetical protein KIT50_09910 [Bacteroidetes bacterium]|nr:hypothetical protein [Bacteroidota bacterium]